MELARELFKTWGYRRLDEVSSFTSPSSPRWLDVFCHCRSCGLRLGSLEDWYERAEQDTG